MDNNTRDILTEITQVTTDIENNYPELQKYLDESRSTLPKSYESNSSINQELENYLNELKELISNYKQ